MLYWSHIPPPPADDASQSGEGERDDDSATTAPEEEEEMARTEALFRQKPSDQIHLSFVVLLSADDHIFVASHAILRLCGALPELLDEIDADTSPPPFAADATTAEIVDLLPMFEVDAPGTTLHSVLEFLERWLRNGRPTTLSRPLLAPLQHLVSEWEWAYLQQTAFTTAGTTSKLSRRPTTAGALAAVIPFVREPTGAARLFHQDRGLLSPPIVQPLLMLMRGADFLGVEPLRDLTCAFLASLVLDKSEGEIAALMGLDQPLTEAQLQPMFQQHRFLRSGGSAANGG